MRWRVLLVATLVLTAGCLSSTDDDPASPDEGDEQGPRTTWGTTTRSGTVSGAGTPAGSVSDGGGNQATWTVPEDTRVMYLNMTAEGAEVTIEYGPDCQTEDTVECEHSASTQDGELREVHEAPAAGSWDAYVFLNNTVGEADWELAASMGVVQR